MAEDITIQRNHKDTVFHDLFSEKENALSLYNALNGTNYPDTDGLEIVTLSDAIYIQRKNDVSVLFQDQLSLWEHQSTINENMPLRGLIYYAHNIDGILRSHGTALYGKKPVKIPAPSYYVFYNGLEDADPVRDLKLSDAFLKPAEGYEWTAHMLNINRAENEGLLKKCGVLEGYVMLIRYIQENQLDGDSLQDAVDKAIKRCIDENFLKEYLLKKLAEVRLMLITEFNQELYEKTIRQEEREEGREEGADRWGQIYMLLAKEKRSDDMQRIMWDKDFRNKLFQTYSL